MLFELGVLGHDALDGLLVVVALQVTDLAEQLADLVSMAVDRPGSLLQSCFGIERAFSPGRLRLSVVIGWRTGILNPMVREDDTVTVSNPYPEATALARAWRSAAERDLPSYAWVPTETERRIAADVAYATKVPTLGLPPYAKDPLWVRLQRLAVWAPVIRLAMAAGPWTLPEWHGRAVTSR